MSPHLQFRDICAQDGVELTPAESKKYFKAYIALRGEIAEAVAQYPNFYLDLCNRTTEQKLDDVAEMNRQGAKMTLKEYNELQAMVKKICELEGYAK